MRKLLIISLISLTPFAAFASPGSVTTGASSASSTGAETLGSGSAFAFNEGDAGAQATVSHHSSTSLAQSENDGGSFTFGKAIGDEIGSAGGSASTLSW